MSRRARLHVLRLRCNVFQKHAIDRSRSISSQASANNSRQALKLAEDRRAETRRV
jgi:hypothetical protein